jgi:hypothetical protein
MTMDDLIEKIRAAANADATDEARTAGADACRALLIALDAKPGEPMASPVPSGEASIVPVPLAPTTQLPTPHAAAQAIVSALRGMTPDQLLDVAIARLRAALPPGTVVPTTQPLKFQLIPVNQGMRP